MIARAGSRFWLRAPILVAAALAMLNASPALASGPLSDSSVRDLTLAVNSKGEALLSYVRSNGQLRHVLVWGAVNALPPDPNVPQVRFKYDYAGGWHKYRNGRYWQTFDNACRPYDGPTLAYYVAGCKAPDGSYWAVQSWQRQLPHRGVDPWISVQTQSSFDVSHWSADLAHLELYSNWAFSHEAHGIFGSLTYNGAPVHGFGTTSSGIPTDYYGRGLYIDTLDSAYGPGWKRETSIVFRKPTGSFCYSFWPTNDITLPGRPRRPAGFGSRYRISVVGPGVTPDVVAEVADVGTYDPSDPGDVEQDRRLVRLFDEVTAGDAFCATQH